MGRSWSVESVGEAFKLRKRRQQKKDSLRFLRCWKINAPSSVGIIVAELIGQLFKEKHFTAYLARVFDMY